MTRPRIKPSICFSTEEHRKQICQEINSISRRTDTPKKYPVLFLWGKPVRKLTENDALSYINLGARVEYLDNFN